MPLLVAVDVPDKVENGVCVTDTEPVCVNVGVDVEVTVNAEERVFVWVQVPEAV